MLALQSLDVEKIAFELIEDRAPAVADMLLVMASRKVPVAELIGQLQLLALNDRLRPRDFDTAVAALLYARRYLNAPMTSH